ncbi:DUF5103 domain-containing protein [Prevotella sp. A2931]|uniref:DUF5103 domain-containing protein n=1 Tax=Prevotella illustrans TaxID=2800387 RepID=A0ABS3M731_9BACT|nr:MULTISPECIES: DUF5103 domain-containing protein [Prevotella]MBO1363944.1 DUF5103 domain-containing protein [Prevotella illustrans]PTL25670.1 DUF5103 domain-containing protein [Prevotella sp. oral taxon 820]
MRRLLQILLTFFLAAHLYGQQTVIYHNDIATVTISPGNDWRSLPIIPLREGPNIIINFDQYGHDYHQYQYKIEHCDADWSVSEGLFPADIADGFLEDLDIKDVEKSINTNILYTHYSFSVPNEQINLKLSGNYKVTVYRAYAPEEVAFECYFMVLDKKMSVRLSVQTNTDIDINHAHQQIEMRVKYGSTAVSAPASQIKTVVLQNRRWDNAVVNPRPQIVSQEGLTWQHNSALIFNGGNEYRKFEVLATDHPTMGIKDIYWDGNITHAVLWTDEPRPNYNYAPSGNGAFIIRNSDNEAVYTTTDYVDVDFTLQTDQRERPIYLNGYFSNDQFTPDYEMTYSPEDRLYHATVRLKQGYYSYQYLEKGPDGRMRPLASEGNFYQTGNQYQALIYYRSLNGRTDELVGYADIQK